jgi:hypothetical protein
MGLHLRLLAEQLGLQACCKLLMHIKSDIAVNCGELSGDAADAII